MDKVQKLSDSYEILQLEFCFLGHALSLRLQVTVSDEQLMDMNSVQWSSKGRADCTLPQRGVAGYLNTVKAQRDLRAIIGKGTLSVRD
jgi:hypothetical protein